MAAHKACAFLAVLCLLLLQNTDAYLGAPIPSPAPSPIPRRVPGPQIDCDAQCGRRCSATKRPNLCKRSCGSCCKFCNCVPSGTSGHHSECSCYANLKTRKGDKEIPKCP